MSLGRRMAVAVVLAIALAWVPTPTVSAKSDGLTRQAVAEASAAQETRPAPKPAAKRRRVIILGTTIVGDVLKPPVDRTIPWQRPAAFRSDAAPVTHDFTTELLTPIDRSAILQEEDDHGP